MEANTPQRWNPTGYVYDMGGEAIEVQVINEQGQVWQGRLACYPGGRVSFVSKPTAPERVPAESIGGGHTAPEPDGEREPAAV